MEEKTNRDVKEMIASLGMFGQQPQIKYGPCGHNRGHDQPEEKAAP